MYRGLFLACFLIASGCASPPPVKQAKEPRGYRVLEGASEIQIVTGEPDKAQCQYLGEVVGQSSDREIELAQKWARNDFKNKTFELGGNSAKLDTTVAGGDSIDFSPRTKIILTGRAFKCK